MAIHLAEVVRPFAEMPIGHTFPYDTENDTRIIGLIESGVIKDLGEAVVLNTAAYEEHLGVIADEGIAAAKEGNVARRSRPVRKGAEVTTDGEGADPADHQ